MRGTRNFMSLLILIILLMYLLKRNNENAKEGVKELILGGMYLFCTSCGSKIKEAAKFCATCGKEMSLQHAGAKTTLPKS